MDGLEDGRRDGLGGGAEEMGWGRDSGWQEGWYRG